MAERDTSPLTTSDACYRRLIDVSQSPDRDRSTEPPGVDMTIPLTLSRIIHAVTSGAARAAEILLHLTPEPRHNAEVAAYRLGYCAARTSGSRSTCAPPPRTSSIWSTPWHRPRSGPRPRASSRPAIRSGSTRTATDFDGPETPHRAAHTARWMGFRCGGHSASTHRHRTGVCVRRGTPYTFTEPRSDRCRRTRGCRRRA